MADPRESILWTERICGAVARGAPAAELAEALRGIVRRRLVASEAGAALRAGVHSVSSHDDPEVSRLARYLEARWTVQRPAAAGRDRARDMLEAALQLEPASARHVMTRDRAALLIEEGLYIRHSGLGTAYNARVRSMYSNLVDADSDLRGWVLADERVARGIATAPQWALKTATVRAADKAAADRRLREVTAPDPMDGALICKEYACPRCRRETVTASQRQTRSADEGMTLFLRCVQCGWARKM
jgi:DNA-directed RNA polymerase subunit M/transcription elongation factor TFIIS